ncbi:MAG: TonB-dependent receptor plug domain-containing protein, partial [Deltaproteobacteria bacterium]|nr:TonB-dependent receptor plug domain-containing protein [Deltaproteobacteria bacterium]
MSLKRVVGVGLALFSMIFWAGPTLGQDDGASEVRLSPIEMVESKDSIDHITQVDFERKTASTLWDALMGVSGIYPQISGGRNEGTISLRGSSRYQVGMYIDDIPIATAYRNEWDFNNTMLFDLESIEVSKGYSSPLLASNNNLAGAINLRTAKPTKELEFTAKYMNFFDRALDGQGRYFAASIGSKQELFYLKASFMFNQQDFFTLPSGFRPAPQEDGGRRENSDYKNRGLNFIVGWTPTEDVDIMFGFVKQSFEKGQPFDAAQTFTAPPNSGLNDFPFARFWRWPKYETTRYYLNGDINLTDKAHLKVVAYYDEHEDASITYSNMNFIGLEYPDKTYVQYTAGLKLGFDYTFNEAHKLA